MPLPTFHFDDQREIMRSQSSLLHRENDILFAEVDESDLDDDNTSSPRCPDASPLIATNNRLNPNRSTLSQQQRRRLSNLPIIRNSPSAAAQGPTTKLQPNSYFGPGSFDRFRPPNMFNRGFWTVLSYDTDKLTIFVAFLFFTIENAFGLVLLSGAVGTGYYEGKLLIPDPPVKWSVYGTQFGEVVDEERQRIDFDVIN